MRGLFVFAVLGVAVPMYLGAACATSTSDEEAQLGGGAASSGGGTGGAGGTPLIILAGGGGQSAGGNGSGGSCVGERFSAESAPLDLYLMLDSSASMAAAAGTGGTKWSAVKSALSSFFADSASSGIQVALQFFPLKGPDNLPTPCSVDADCGINGPCGPKACDKTPYTLCMDASDCGGVACVRAGSCQFMPGSLCWPLEDGCFGGALACLSPQKVCASRASCDTAEYAAPALDMAALPGAATALNNAIAARPLDGFTPTSAALSGAVDYAATWGSAHPSHRTAVVFISDGEPTECYPTDPDRIADAAAAARTGSPSIATFVIGVVSSLQQGGGSTLAKIAVAGGTGQPYYIDPTSNVESGFSAALQSIRQTALACDYTIPKPTTGTADHGRVNVEHTPTGSSTAGKILYVGSRDNCDPINGGWHYDVDPDSGTPSKIEICDATCSSFQDGGVIDIQVGCETVIATPK